VGEDRLVDRRVLVMGASAGIGRVIGLQLSAAGAHVGFAARRLQLCEAAAREATGTAAAFTCDVTDEMQCRQVVDDVVARLGRLDDVVFSTGALPLVALEAADAGAWRRTLETNVMGAALLTKYALPQLRRSRGSMIFLSSVSSVGPAWPGFGVYTASKAALNRLVETLRAEHPEVSFVRIFVGPTADSSTGMDVDPSAMEHMLRWRDLGLLSGETNTPAAIADAVRFVLASESRIADVTVTPSDPPLPWTGVPEDVGP
jgi:NAD(P)-dependent dehydrogenase (short-subunit alcohol dehydrogenase family)